MLLFLIKESTATRLFAEAIIMHSSDYMIFVSDSVIIESSILADVAEAWRITRWSMTLVMSSEGGSQENVSGSCCQMLSPRESKGNFEFIGFLNMA